ncbi:MAG TPA: cell wall hydrolase [Allosphingosinicella sp.]|jgi:spore germination cell wall hydrolase CwlJ-like protein
MNRIVRSAGFAAAAFALVAGASYSDPAAAGETLAPAVVRTLAPRAPEASVASEASAASTMTDPSLFSKMWANVTALVSPKSETTAPTGVPAAKPLADLVAAYAGTQAADREMECLANAVYFEARSEPIEGQLAVAEVVLNRASSGRYPTDLCAVITQKAQFSFIRRGRFPSADRGSEAWKKAVAIASIARQKLAGNLPSSVLWYHATYVSPKWGKRLTRQTQIGLHIFYS